MGTPLRGADLAQWASRLAQSVALIKQTNHKILDVLQRESETLSQIQDNFLHLVRKREQNGTVIELVCMCEELPVPGVGLVSSNFLPHTT
jgi:protein SERAC1